MLNPLSRIPDMAPDSVAVVGLFASELANVVATTTNSKTLAKILELNPGILIPLGRHTSATRLGDDLRRLAEKRRRGRATALGPTEDGSHVSNYLKMRFAIRFCSQMLPFSLPSGTRTVRS
jgi:hypothetical protein